MSKKIMICVGILAAVVISGIIVWEGGNKNRTEETGDSPQSEMLLAEDGVPFDYKKTGTIDFGEYKGVQADVEPDDEDVEIELSCVLDDMKLADDNRTIHKGDYVYIDYSGSVDGQELESQDQSDILFVVGEYRYVKALEDVLVGKEAGNTCLVPIEFPQDYGDPEVAGKVVNYKINIKSKFDDAYAKQVSKGKYKTVSAYMGHLRDRLRKENMENRKDIAWDALTEECTVNEYPDKLVKEEIKNLNLQYAAFADVNGMTKEELLESLMMDEDSVAETAQDIVRDRMIAKTIAEWENISLDDGTLKKYLIELMEYEDSDDTALDELLEDYNEDYGSRPRDDVLVELAKELVEKNAVDAEPAGDASGPDAADS